MKIKVNTGLRALATWILESSKDFEEDVRALIAINQIKTWLTNLQDNVYQDDAELSFDEACGLMMLFCAIYRHNNEHEIFFRIVDNKIQIINEEELDELTSRLFPGKKFNDDSPDIDVEEQEKVLEENNLGAYLVLAHISSLIDENGGDYRTI